MAASAAIIVVPASIVVRLTTIDDTNQTVLLPNFGILGASDQVVTQVGGTPLGFPNREPAALADARCAFAHTFDAAATAALSSAVPEAEIFPGSTLPGDWRTDGGI